MVNPLTTILDMLLFLIKSIIESIIFVASKTIEFFLLISDAATASTESFIASIIIGSIVLFLVAKYIFGASKELILIMLIFLILLIAFLTYRFML